MCNEGCSQVYIFANILKATDMNIKRIFGSVLTILGIASLIYTAVLFTNSSENTHAVKSLITFGVLGFVFFISGIGLIRMIKDEA